MARRIVASGRTAGQITVAGRSGRVVTGRGRSPKVIGRDGKAVTGTGDATLIILAFGESVGSAGSPNPDPITGTGAAVFSGFSGAATGQHIGAVFGAHAGTIDAFSASAVGFHAGPAITAAGDATFSLQADGFGYVGTFTVEGAGAATLVQTALGAGTAYESFTGAGSATFGITQTAAGSHFSLVTGSGNSTLTLTASGSGGFSGGATGASFTADFVTGSYSGCSVADFTVSQASARTALNASGGTVSFPANTPRITNRGWYLSSAQGDLSAIGGAPATLLGTSTWTLFIDLDADTDTASSLSGSVLSCSSEIMRIAGFTSISNGSTVAATGMGGFQGIGRLGITSYPGGFALCLNGGTVAVSASPLTLAGTFRLLASLNVGAFARKLKGDPVQSTPAQLKAATSIVGQSFVNPPTGALNLSTATLTFEDDFTSNTIRTRSGNPDTSPVAPDVLPMIALYDTVGNWIPRYVFHTRDAAGSAQEPINQEYQEYMDPQRTGNYNPFTISNSILTITAQHYNNLTSGQKALVGTDPNHGGPYQYVSGCLTTPRKFKQKYGYFECRAKMPNASKSWPAFWMLPAENSGVEEYSSIAELDVVEIVGFGNPGYDTSTMHWNNYASNPGAEHFWPYDTSADFHTYACHWIPGSVRAYRDGVLMTTIATGGNFDTNPMYLLLNLAIGGSWPGTPDAATVASMPLSMQVDYVRVWTVT